MKPTQALFKRVSRLTLTTKMANKGFYKGTGTGSTGRHTKHGGYVIEWEKVRTYVCPPDLKSFKLTPFITKRMRAVKGRFPPNSKGPLDGGLYLENWKREGGEN